MAGESPEARIAAVVSRVPPGRVTSYGRVADLAGLPGRARLVGRVLSRWGGDPLPWHRVVRADGRIAFPPGSTPFRRQSALLRAEGVRLRDGRVDLARCGWAGDLDALLWGPSGDA